jgi:hypothetical protein
MPALIFTLVNIFLLNSQRHCHWTARTILALATLGDITQIESMCPVAQGGQSSRISLLVTVLKKP